jgi:spermidine synthase
MVRSSPLERTVAALVFGSGLCALVYQVTWLRELRLVFGASTPASAAVLAVFMGGLGLGSLVLGRRAERSARPLAFYGWLELGAALGAGLTPWTVAAVRAAYIAAGGTSTLGVVGGTLLRLALTAVVLGVPTFLMGGTLPAVCRAVTGAADRSRRSLGWLYGCNTIGALAGATLATFVLLEVLGQRKSLWLAALVNLLVGSLAVMIGRRQEPLGSLAGEGEEPPQREAAAPLPVVLGAAALAGVAFFLMELVWYRLLAPLLGGSTYTFGIILILALAGIGTGGLIYGARRRDAPPSLASFAATCALEAVVLIVPLALSNRLAVLASSLRGLESLGFDGLVAGWLVVAGIVVLPASAVAGYQFPLLVALLGSGRREVAAQTGRVTAWNTAGAIAGSLAGGFGLMPLLGAPGAWRATTVLLALLALLGGVVALSRGLRPRRLAAPAGVALAAAALCLLPGPGALWRYGEIGVGRGLVERGGANDLRARIHREESSVVWEEDGLEGSVALSAFGGYSFSINGKTDGHSRFDAGTQVMAALVGSMLHPAPRRTLVIGLGTGSSAGWLAAVPDVERVEVVELEPAVVRVARDCAPVNHDALDNPRLELTLGDGREYLLTRDGPWDLVFSEPSNPYRAGIASLFTREFYAAVDERLAPGGIFVQWLQAYEVSPEVVASVYTSLAGVFPHVETWSASIGDLLLVASASPLRHDLARVQRRASAEPYRSALADSWGVWGAEGFYSSFLAGADFARRMASSGAAPNLDDRPVIEFGFARDLGRSPFDIGDMLRELRPNERRPAGLEGLGWDRMAEVRSARTWTQRTPLRVPPGQPSEARNRWLARQASSQDRLAAAATHWAGQPESPMSLHDALLVAEGWAELADPRVLVVVRELLADRPVESGVLLARWHLRSGRPAEAAAHLERGLVAYRDDPWPWPMLTGRALRLAHELGKDPALARRLLPALSQPFAVRMHEQRRVWTRAMLALRVGGDACRAAFNAYEPWPLWDESFLRLRLHCYRKTGDPLAEASARDLARFLDQRPSTLKELLESPATPPGELPGPADAR